MINNIKEVIDLKILAIDTSSKICSVSILEDHDLIIEKHIYDERTHSEKIMPLIDEILKECKIDLKEISLLACCIRSRFIYRC